MTVQQIVDEKNFNEKIQQDKLTLVDFFADWCAPCRQIAIVLSDLAAKGGDNYEICKIDIDNEKNISIASKYMIASIPTVLFFKKGKLVHRFTGMQNEKAIQGMIDEYSV